MSYLTQSKLAFDAVLADRVTACAASERVSDPAAFAVTHRWELSAQPGWVDAYASAIAGGDQSPGANEGAITDGMILAAVQSINQNPAE